MNRFADQRAVVTGAAQGIGEAIARRLAQEGAEVVLVDRNRETLSAAVHRLETDFPGATAEVLDVTDSAAVTKTLQGLEETGPLHILVNNAGILRDGWIEQLEDEDWNSVVAVNLTGTFHCCRAVVSGMKKRGYGRIVNVSSRVWQGNAGQVNYSASKAGLIGLTRSLALELVRFGINVNAVAPGLIDTPMIQGLAPEVRLRLEKAQPGGRMGSADEVAAAVSFLASREASFVTGQILHVCGGKSVGTGAAP